MHFFLRTTTILQTQFDLTLKVTASNKQLVNHAENIKRACDVSCPPEPRHYSLLGSALISKSKKYLLFICEMIYYHDIKV